MSERNFRKMLETKWAEGKFVCVGLDSEFEKLPKHLHLRKEVSKWYTTVAFNQEIIRATKDLVCAYKPNIAFYEALGDEGLRALQETIRQINGFAPDVPVILDAKRADIGNTNAGYVKMAFEYLGVDAITVHPYLGREALQPFLDCKDKGIIVLCRTSNPGAGEFQDLGIDIYTKDEVDVMKKAGFRYGPPDLSMRVEMSNHVAYQVSKNWNANANCALVVGATYPEELQEIRAIVGDMPILIPGIGAQGGDVEKTVKAGKDSRGWGMIINSSRGIIFASSDEDFAEAARRETLKLHEEINKHR